MIVQIWWFELVLHGAPILQKYPRFSEIKNITIPKFISIDTFKNDRVPDLLSPKHMRQNSHPYYFLCTPPHRRRRRRRQACAAPLHFTPVLFHSVAVCQVPPKRRFFLFFCSEEMTIFLLMRRDARRGHSILAVPKLSRNKVTSKWRRSRRRDRILARSRRVAYHSFYSAECDKVETGNWTSSKAHFNAPYC